MKLKISEVEVQNLSVKPGDILFFRLPCGDIKAAQLKEFGKSIRKILPKGVKAVFTCSDGMDITKITPEVK